jgi:hypothetical protein
MASVQVYTPLFFKLIILYRNQKVELTYPFIYKSFSDYDFFFFHTVYNKI